MINVQIVDYPVLIAFWLGFSRFLVIMVQLPLFDTTSVPGTVKILMALLLSYAFFPEWSPHILKDINHLGTNNFWMLTIFNVVVGLFIGLLVKVIMGIYVAAGSIISQQVGFGAVRYFDPTSVQQIGLFEKLVRWTIIIMILSTGALYPMIEGILNSFRNINYLDFDKAVGLTPFYLRFFKSAFVSSLMLASPLIFTHVLIMAILGIISRVVPQMNVLLISFVVNIGLGLLVFWACSGEFFIVAYRLYVEKLGNWFQFLL